MIDEDKANDVPMPSELEVLKNRARLMGVEFSNNIGLETLKERLRAHQEGQKTAAAAEPAVNEVNPLAGVVSEKMSLRKQLQVEQMKLIRVRVTNMDPKKKDLPGEIFTVANEYIGTVRKFVPYGEATENGYHIPWCLYEFLNTKKFQNIVTRKNKTNGQIQIITSWVKEFAFEVLPPLTAAELDDLKKAQLATGSIDRNAA